MRLGVSVSRLLRYGRPSNATGSQLAGLGRCGLCGRVTLTGTLKHAGQITQQRASGGRNGRAAVVTMNQAHRTDCSICGATAEVVRFIGDRWVGSYCPTHNTHSDAEKGRAVRAALESILQDASRRAPSRPQIRRHPMYRRNDWAQRRLAQEQWDAAEAAMAWERLALLCPKGADDVARLRATHLSAETLRTLLAYGITVDDVVADPQLAVDRYVYRRVLEPAVSIEALQAIVERLPPATDQEVTE